MDEFEKGHGFVVVGERLPNFVGFVYGNVFKNALEQGEHWKDVGAGKDHGKYSHRLQWYLVISAGAIKSVDPNGEVIVYKSIAKWQKGRTKDGVEKNLWTRHFDLPKTDGSIGNDQEDFRSPENLNLWLTGNENPTFCPVLRSFLRARMAKRANLNADKYLQEKLKFSDEQMGEYQNWLVTEAEQKKRPSKRIVFPQGKKPVLSPYVGEVKEF